jgi:glucokinase
MEPLLATDIPDGAVVDLGGTKVMVGIARGGEIVTEATFPTGRPSDPEPMISSVAATITGLARSAGVQVEAVAVAVPGALDREAGIVRRAANLALRDYPLAASLSGLLGGVPVTIENDASLGLVGEVVAGAARGLTDVVYLTVSTGIGMSALIGGRLLAGARGLAGEIGHIRMHPGGRTCGCGSSGCLEAYASGRAIGALGREARAAGRSSALAAMSADAITAREVVAAAELGDDTCAEIVSQAVDLLAMTIDTVLRILDPAVVVLGGGVMSSEYMTKLLSASWPASADQQRIRMAQLGERSVMIGGTRFLRALDR